MGRKYSVIFITTVLIVAIVAWVVVSFLKEQDAYQAVSEPETTEQSNAYEGYLVIKEWGVKLKLKENIEDLTYFRPKNISASFDRLDFSTKSLVEREPYCGEVGYLSILRSERVLEYGQLIKQIGQYKYYYFGADAACSQNDANIDFELQKRLITQQAIYTLEKS